MFKRKRSVDDESEPHWLAAHSADDSLGPTQSLCVEAHEVDLVSGKETLALALEAPVPDDEWTTNATPATGTSTRGSGLIKWSGTNGGNKEIWVDRFDARLLLSELPSPCSSQTQTKSTPDPGSPLSSSGWSDLPSDTEDAFFLSPSELADFRYTKARRQLEEARMERLAALRAAGDDFISSEDLDEDVWGGSDEEPDATQLLLMDRTAAHLHASPDRIRLVARILANHGADKRFAFLRGRWRRAWLRAQAKVVAEKEEQKKILASGTQLMGLADYGDSDEDEDENNEEQDPDALPLPLPSLKDNSDDTGKMEARRARAREWAAKRRAEKVIASENSTNQ